MVRIFLSPSLPSEIEQGIVEAITLFAPVYDLQHTADQAAAHVVIVCKEDLPFEPTSGQRLVLYLPPSGFTPRDLPPGTMQINSPCTFKEKIADLIRS